MFKRLLKSPRLKNEITQIVPQKGVKKKAFGTSETKNVNKGLNPKIY